MLEFIDTQGRKLEWFCDNGLDLETEMWTHFVYHRFRLHKQVLQIYGYMLSTPHMNPAVRRNDTLAATSTHSTHTQVSNTILQIKGPRLFGEITDSRPGAGNIQNELGTPSSRRKEACVWGLCACAHMRTHTHSGALSKMHRNQVQELLEANSGAVWTTE